MSSCLYLTIFPSWPFIHKFDFSYEREYYLPESYILGSSAIDCYQCTSKNGTDKHCEDAMAPAFVPLESNCKVPKPGHIGMFPAVFCVKMTGVSGKQIML